LGCEASVDVRSVIGCLDVVRGDDVWSWPRLVGGLVVGIDVG
jgi:hypothetical protein